MYRKEDINFHEQCSLINIIEPSKKLHIYHDIIYVYYIVAQKKKKTICWRMKPKIFFF